MASSFADMSNIDYRPILLGAADVRRALSMPDAIEAMKAGFADLSAGDAIVPARTYIPLDEYDGNALFMPGYSEGQGLYAVKVASIHRANKQRGLEAVQALVLLFDAATGRLEALLDGRSITAIRTAAGSGLATRLLARDDAKVVVILGSGVQARSHLEAVTCVREIEHAYCMGTSIAKAEPFAFEASMDLGIRVTATDDRSVLREADIICTTTTATEPLFGLEEITRGVHINAIGTHRPEDAEVGGDVVAESKLVVDQVEACLKEAGDILRPIKDGLISRDHIHAEIGEVAAGLKPGREEADEITLFKSVGNAIQDLAAAAMAAKDARRLGLGREITI